MKRLGTPRASTWGTPIGRIAAAVLAIGALSAMVMAPTAAGAATNATATTVSTAKDTKLGTILVSGTTVYTLKPSKTKCTGKCLKVWPPVLLPAGTMAPTAGTGVDGSKLGTVAAANGALQITYGGKPLYWFAKDKTAGQVHGNVKDEWGKWSSVTTAKASSGSSGGSDNKTNAGTGGTSF